MSKINQALANRGCDVLDSSKQCYDIGGSDIGGFDIGGPDIGGFLTTLEALLKKTLEAYPSRGVGENIPKKGTYVWVRRLSNTL